MHTVSVYLRGSSLADLTQPESGGRSMRWFFYCPDSQKGWCQMKWFDCLKISLVLLGLLVGPVVGGDQSPRQRPSHLYKSVIHN